MVFTQSLKKNYQFKFVYNRGKSNANRILVMYVSKNGTSSNRLGLSVSKRVGNSVVRNRVRRLIRESYRLNELKVARGFDIIIIARAGSKDLNFADMSKSVLHLLRKHKLI